MPAAAEIGRKQHQQHTSQRACFLSTRTVSAVSGTQKNVGHRLVPRLAIVSKKRLFLSVHHKGSVTETNCEPVVPQGDILHLFHWLRNRCGLRDDQVST